MHKHSINWWFAIKAILVLPFLILLFAFPIGLWMLIIVSYEYWRENSRAKRPNGIFFHAKKEFTDF